MSKKIELAEVCHKNFEEHQKETFTFDCDLGRFEVVLDKLELRTMRSPGQEGLPKWVREQPFSLVFLGPRSPEFCQGNVRLEHPGLGSLEPVFVVCTMANEKGRYYNVEFS